MPLERKAGEQEVLRESSHHQLTQEGGLHHGRGQWYREGEPHIPLRGSLLLIKRHWLLLSSTARHIIQHSSNRTFHTMRAPPSIRKLSQEHTVPQQTVSSLATSHIICATPHTHSRKNGFSVAHNLGGCIQHSFCRTSQLMCWENLSVQGTTLIHLRKGR